MPFSRQPYDPLGRSLPGRWPRLEGPLQKDNGATRLEDWGEAPNNDVTVPGALGLEPEAFAIALSKTSVKGVDGV